MTSWFYESATADPLLYQGGYAKVDLHVGYGPPSRNWEVALVGKNLTDRLTSAFRQNITGTSGAIEAIPDPPRTISVQFSVKH
jgi:outer membrane receptor protein involved in Fe transport